MEFTFKGYTVAELCSFHGHQFMGVIKGNTFVWGSFCRIWEGVFTV